MDYRRIIQNSVDYIEDNLKTEITAAELAQQAGFSLYHYCRLFQLSTGMPVMRFILRRRLLHAIYEIRQGRTRIDVVLNYGFETYAGFYKAFQREFGCTPSRYLNSDRVRYPCRPNLSKEEHVIVTHKKAAEILKHWNLENEMISDIYCDGSGEKKENAFYIGTEYVLKYSVNPGELAIHAELSKSMERQGMCAATPVKTMEGKEWLQDGELYFSLTNRIKGNQILPNELYNKGGAAFVGEIIGRLHLALRDVDAVVNDVDIYDTVKSWALPGAKEILDLPQDFCHNYIAAFGVLYDKLPRQIIHRDPNPGNIILSGDKWGFIDFDLSERNLRIFDLCYAATAVLSESFDKTDTVKRNRWLELYKDMISGYDKAAHLTVDEREAIPYVILANQLICVAWFGEQEKYPELYETNKQMTQWLIENFQQLMIG